MKKLLLLLSILFVLVSMNAQQQTNQSIVSTGNFLFLKVTPKDAMVTIDENHFLKLDSEGILKVYLPSGQHHYRIEAYGHKPVIGTVEMKGERITLPVTLHALEEKIHITVNGIAFNMINVHGGTFTMGATSEMSDSWSNETPTHQVSLSSYYIGETEVPQKLWKAVMGKNPSYYKGDDLPVSRVSWNDCQAFIRKLNELTNRRFRLPTEAEWEFAARGGIKSNHTPFSGSSNIDDVAWYVGNSGSKPHPVMTKKPNELGIYDMSGNVCEWCQDWYGNYNRDAQTNPTGPASGSYRVNRGGGWNYKARVCRLSCRFKTSPDSNIDNYLGFRLVLVD